MTQVTRLVNYSTIYGLTYGRVRIYIVFAIRWTLDIMVPWLNWLPMFGVRFGGGWTPLALINSILRHLVFLYFVFSHY